MSGSRRPSSRRPSWGFPGAAASVLLILVTPALADTGILQDPTLTPGAVRTINVGEICSTSTRELRHWDSERSELIFARYHIAREDRINFTLDHLVPLEVGGADVIENIWPEARRSLAGEWDDTRKNQS